MAGDTKTLMIRLVGNAKSATKAASDTERAYDSLDTKLKDVGKKWQDTGKKLSSTGKSLTTKLTLPIVGIGAYSVKTAAEFEQTMNVLQTNTGASAKRMSQLEQQAKDLGKATVFSANESADAMLELAKGGFTPAQIAGGGVQATMALAATEGMNLADAATVVANNMNAFSINAKNATQIADALAGASAASTASVGSLSEGLSNVGGSARNMGFDLNDTVGVLAALDQNSIRGAAGGTALNSLLTHLSKPTAAAQAALDKYNISLTNSDGSFKNITNIAGQFQDKLGKLNDKQKAAVVTTIAGTYGQKALNALIKEGDKGLGKYIKSTEQQGAAQKMANARMSGTAGAIEQMRGSLETAALSIGQALAPTITKVANFIGTLADKFTALPQPVQNVILIVGGVVAVLGPLLVIVGSVVSAIGAMIPVFGAVVGAIAAISAPVLIVIAALAALVAAVVLVIKYHKQIGKAIGKAWDAVKSAAKAVGNWFTKSVPQFFVKAWDKAKAAVSKGISAVVGFIKSLPGKAGAALGSLASRITAPFTKAWNAASGAVTRGINKVVGLVKSIPGRITGAIGDLGGLLVGAGRSILDGLISGITDKIGDVQGLLGKVTSWIPDWKGPKEKDKKLLTPAGHMIMDGFRDGLKSRIPKIKELLRNFSASLAKGIDDKPLAKAVDKLGTKLEKQLKASQARLQSLVSKRNDVISSVAGINQSVFGNATDAYGFTSGSYIIQSAQEQLEQGVKLTNALKAVTKMGLSKDLIQQFVNSGESGLQQLYALANGPKSVITQLNAINSKTNQAYKNAGIVAGNNLYGQQIKQANKQVKIEVRVNSMITEKNFAKKITPVIREELVKIARRNGGKLI